MVDVQVIEYCNQAYFFKNIKKSHLKFEIPSAIPASNDEKCIIKKKTEQDSVQHTNQYTLS